MRLEDPRYFLLEHNENMPLGEDGGPALNMSSTVPAWVPPKDSELGSKIAVLHPPGVGNIPLDSARRDYPKN